MNLYRCKWAWLLPAMLLIPNFIWAQKIDADALKPHKLYYWGGLNLGGGWGAVGRSDGGGPAYGVSANLLMDHNFMKIKAAVCQDLTNAFIIFGGGASRYSNYDLLLGRQLPIGKKGSFSIATGIARLKYYSEFNLAPQEPPLNYIQTGVPLEFTIMRSAHSAVGGTLSFEMIFTNKQTMGNLTIGIALGKVREKLDDDKSL